jgi:hypothetical protein
MSLLRHPYSQSYIDLTAVIWREGGLEVYASEEGPRPGCSLPPASCCQKKARDGLLLYWIPGALRGSDGCGDGREEQYYYGTEKVKAE